MGGAHEGEKDDLADVLGAGEHHNEPVNADAATAGGGHAAFDGVKELLIHGMGLLIAFGALLHLLGKPLPLINGIIELAEGVADLLSPHVAFEPSGETGMEGVPLCQRRGLDWVAHNKRGLLKGGFHKDLEKLFDEAA